MSDSMRQLELRLATILRVGVTAVAALMASGWAWLLARERDSLSRFRVYEPEPLQLVARRAWESGDGARILLYAGLGLLILLPLVRVSLTALLLARRSERGLAAVAFFVFLALIGSLLLGIEF